MAESCKHFYEGKNEGKRFSKLHEFLSKHIGTYERGPTEIPIQFFGSRPKPHFLYSSNPRRCMNNDRYQGFRIRHRIIDEAERSFDLPKINIFFFSFFFFQTWNKPIARTVTNYLVVKVVAYLGQSPFLSFAGGNIV